MDFVVGGVQSISSVHPVESSKDEQSFSYLLTGENALLQVIAVAKYLLSDNSTTSPNNGSNDAVALVEFCIQFRPTVDPFWGNVCSTECRTFKQKFKVNLPQEATDQARCVDRAVPITLNDNDREASHSHSEYYAVLSSDSLSMVCVFPSPTKKNMLVQFDIQRVKPPSLRMKTSREFPKPPSYITKVPESDQLCYLAKNPRLVAGQFQPTCVCFSDNDNALLVGCENGALHLVLDSSEHHWMFRSAPIRILCSQSLDGSTSEQVAIVYDDGRLVCASLCFPVNGVDAAVTSQHELPCRNVGAVEWVEVSRLAVIEQSGREIPSVSVYLLQSDGNIQKIAFFLVNREDLMHNCHYTIQNDNDTSSVVKPLHLERNPWNGSILAISLQYDGTPFSLLWNWKTNVQGFTAQGSALLRFAWDPSKGKRNLFLVRKTVAAVEKIMFELAISSCRNLMNGMDPCLLSNKVIWIPSISRRTTLRAFGRKWEQIRLPHRSVLVAGSPSNYAVAGAHGLSVLRLFSASPTRQCSFRNVSNIIKAGTVQYKWIRYRHDFDEQSFQVIAMTWWNMRSGYNGDSSDLLVAVIEMLDNEGGSRECTYRLVIWPAEAIGHTTQLAVLETRHLSNIGSEIGIQLHFREVESLRSLSLQILETPCRRSACLLLCENTIKSPYMVYQLEPTKTKNEIIVVCVPRVWGEIGSPADIFVADFSEDPCDEQSWRPSIILGVVRKGQSQGLDSMIVDESIIVALGAVVNPPDLANTCISAIYPLPNDDSAFVRNHDRRWCVHLSDHRLCLWDFTRTDDPASLPVHSASPSMGHANWIGNTLHWMMSSDSGASSVHWLGLLSDGKATGVMISSGQTTCSKRRDMMIFAPQRITMFPFTRFLSSLHDIEAGHKMGRIYPTVNLVFCIQVLLLRYISVRDKPMVGAAVSCLKSVTTTIQFHSIVVKLGRQLEGSFLRELFPIPTTKSKPEDIFSCSLVHGSWETALHCIPLIEDPVMIQTKCSALIHTYLNDLVEATGLSLLARSSIDRNALIISHSASLVAALYRYSLNTQIDDDIDEDAETTSYSIMCGILPKLYWASNRASPSLLISPRRASRQRNIPNGELLLLWHCYPVGYFSSAHLVLSRLLVSEVFTTENDVSWSHLGAIAMVTFNSQSKQTSGIDASQRISTALRSLDIQRFGALVGNITDFLERNVHRSNLSMREASCLFDLCLSLMSNRDSADTAGLLLISLVACHLAEREDELNPCLDSQIGKTHVVLLSYLDFQSLRSRQHLPGAT